MIRQVDKSTSPLCPMDEAAIKKEVDQFWGAVSVIKMCTAAASAHLEHPGEVDLTYMAEALNFALGFLIETGTNVFPALTICERILNEDIHLGGRT